MATTATVSSSIVDRPLSRQLRDAATLWARSQHRLVTLAADFADSAEWVLDGSPTAAHWLAQVADVETCTTREWIRVGRLLRSLPATADAFANSTLSYAKIRALTRIATPTNETELLDIAHTTTANDLPRALAAWLNRHGDLDTHHQRRRSLNWRTEPDAMTTFTIRLPPLPAGHLIAAITTTAMRTSPRPAADEPWPTLAQHQADTIDTILTTHLGVPATEIILHVRGDGATLDDGTPIPDSVIERIAPSAFFRALIHDADQHPVNASTRRRHPTTRQKRVVKERDRTCIDCGRHDLLEYDHNPPHHHSGRTHTNELELRCAPCHHKRHLPTPNTPDQE